MSDTVCPICVRSVLDSHRGIGCEGDCERWFHMDCIKMSLSEYNKFANDKNLKWYCLRADCKPTAMQPLNSTLSTLSNLLDKMNAIDLKLNALMEVPAKIDQIQSNISQINDKLDNVDTRLTGVETHIDGLETRITALEGINMATDQSAEEVFAELNDRKKRSKNVIIYNLSESLSTSTQARVSSDTSNVKILLSKFVPNEASIPFKCTRIGRASRDKARPLKVVFETDRLPRSLCSGFSQAEIAKTHPDLSNVNVSYDRTEKERKHLASLRAKLQARLDKGEKDITIRYINGIPTITQVKSKN